MLDCCVGRIVRRVRLVIGALIATLAIGTGLMVLAVMATSSASAKTPGKTYCFNGICHRVNTIPEMVALVGRDQTFQTSFYDDCKRDRFNPCGLTSSGEMFRPNDADNAASPIYPNGTVLLVRNPANGFSAVVRVNNAGPYWGKRKLDVSRGTADRLGFKKRGVANLEVRVMAAPTLDEAKYKKNRRYAPVPGPIGAFASLDRAQGGMMVAMAFNALSGSVLGPAASKMLTGLRTASPKLVLALRAGGHVASADGVPVDDRDAAMSSASPAEGLKAAARRAYGIERRTRTTAPFSFTAEIAPIHRSRPNTKL